MKKMEDERSSDKKIGSRKSAKRTFKSFAEYWHFVKDLQEYQRKLLINCMSTAERRTLKMSYDKGGWEDLFMRNACDEALDEIKKRTISPETPEGIDLLEIRLKVLNGKPYLIHKVFWHYVNHCFSGVPFEHISYIFDGITFEDYDSDYIKLIKIPLKN